MVILLVVNVISDITDHFTQFCIVRSLTVIGKNVKCSFRDYSHFYMIYHRLIGRL